MASQALALDTADEVESIKAAKEAAIRRAKVSRSLVRVGACNIAAAQT